MELHGIHHVTAVTGDAPANVDFYTQVLGLRLVKKSVNQDDVSAYHLFYADKLGSPGTDMTFFDWPQTPPNQPGTDSISRTSFRVNGRAALDYWVERFDSLNVRHGGIETFTDRTLLRFEDPEGQRLALVDDRGVPFEGEIWDQAGIPAEHAIRGFHGITLSVPRLAAVGDILVRLLGLEATANHPHIDSAEDRVTIFAMDGGGPGREVYVLEQPDERPARLGRGGVHHVAFRVTDDEEQGAWIERLNRAGVRHSGVIDRYYFRSVYFRISPGILFELATDGPGFTADEPLETLGKRLALPPFLEPQRQEIEAGLKPLPTRG
jgi:glyoxalase family protein